jgi:hypothetical protein
VQQVDRENRTLLVRDANNAATVVHIPDDEPEVDSIAPGDTISIVSTETIELELMPPGVSAHAATTDLTAMLALLARSS